MALLETKEKTANSLGFSHFGLNPGIATKACQFTEMAKGMAPVKIARKLFLSQADNELYRPCYIAAAGLKSES